MRWLLVRVAWTGFTSSLAAVGGRVTFIASTLAVVILVACSPNMRVTVVFVMVMVVAVTAALLVPVSPTVKVAMLVRVDLHFR